MTSKTSIIPLITIIRKEVVRFLRIWSQSLIPPILTSTLFILIFGYSLGSRISEVGGVSYLEFILPGLLMMGVIMSAYAASSFSLFIQKFHGSIQELLVAPIAYWQIITGLTISAMIRSLIVGLGILGVSLFFTSVSIHNIFILISFILLVSMLFSFAGIATALWANNFDQMSVFSTFLITPLTYLGGVFYSINMLPPFWANVAKFNPILYMVDGFRYGFIGVSDIPVLYSFSLVLGLTVIFFAICVYMFKTGYNLRT
jgi:ABC-2 type transport system permease protein